VRVNTEIVGESGGFGPSVTYLESTEFPGYQAGTDGSVWCCLVLGRIQGRRGKWRQLKPTLGRRSGYLHVDLRRPGQGSSRERRVNKRVHHFILETFLGPPPIVMECRHKNGIRTDNRLDNLLWGTRSDNMQDAVHHGTIKRGVKQESSKLDDEKIRAILLRLRRGETQKAISDDFGVSNSIISEINSGKAWKHVRRDS
jgi:hypothetical protein